MYIKFHSTQFNKTQKHWSETESIIWQYSEQSKQILSGSLPAWERDINKFQDLLGRVNWPQPPRF
jgi:hypothetical protein